MPQKLREMTESAVNLHGEAAIFIGSMPSAPAAATVRRAVVTISFADGSGAVHHIEAEAGRAAMSKGRLLIIEVGDGAVTRDTLVSVKRGFAL